VFEYFREYTPAPEAASADEQFVAADAGVSVESVREAFAEPAATPSDAVTRDKERKEQIAEVETEIDLLCKVWPAYYPSDSATMERVVDVEKARLAELKRGLREVPRG
jgi:DNA-binding transcriptional MerR regulator